MIEDEKRFEKCQSGIIESLKDIGRREYNIKPTSLLERILVPIDKRTTICVARIAGFSNEEIESYIKEGFNLENAPSIQ